MAAGPAKRKFQRNGPSRLSMRSLSRQVLTLFLWISIPDDDQLGL